MTTTKLSAAPAPLQAVQQPSKGDDEPPANPPPMPRPRAGSRRLLLVESAQDGQALAPGATCMTAADFLDAAAPTLAPGTTIVNLCRSYKYLSLGYYCSLLAEARGHRVYPSVKTINDLSRKAAYSHEIDDLDHALNRALGGPDCRPMPSEFAMDIHFGSADFAPLDGLARRIFATFPAPAMRVEFERGGEHGGDWHIRALRVLNVAALEPHRHALFEAALRAFQPDAPALSASARRGARHHVAILHDPDEALPPSNRAALDNFIRVGRELDIHVALIEKRDLAGLARHDALLIRETTAINHHTYLFAKQAESEGLAVIDDAASILRCTNKIFLADLLRLNGIPTPRTYVLQAAQLGDTQWLEREIGYPMVMKVPDGAFSRGVSKVADRAEFERTARELLAQSSLILVQEYLYTEFDWRIGVLNGEAIFASQYYMSKGHWQVAKRGMDGKAEFGLSRAVPLEAVPAEILDHAVRAARLIGDSLYGVDMKMSARGPVVIEVNDNPNIDASNEDGVLGDELYRLVLRDLTRRADLLARRH
jgi:glutathione synthase/RimK-type ligase-like ATP-grasp enzyme